MRKEAKTYGTCKLAEGADYAGKRVTIIEDVITTGGAVRDATRALREGGAIVEVVVCAIDRSPRVRTRSPTSASRCVQSSPRPTSTPPPADPPTAGRAGASPRSRPRPSPPLVEV